MKRMLYIQAKAFGNNMALFNVKHIMLLNIEGVKQLVACEERGNLVEAWVVESASAGKCWFWANVALRRAIRLDKEMAALSN